jgi:hypothetical protein
MAYLLCVSSPLSSGQAGEMMTRLGFMKSPVAKFVRTKEACAEILRKISVFPPESPSAIFSMFNGLEDEGLAAVMAGLKNMEAKKMVAVYMTQLRHVLPSISGSDLLELGVGRGPDIGKILSAVRMEKLDGRLVTKEEELGFAKELHEKR